MLTVWIFWCNFSYLKLMVIFSSPSPPKTQKPLVMTKANLNRMTMCQTVQALLLGEHDLWKGNIGFAESVGELGACIDAIDAAANAQMSGNTVGVTRDKKKLAKAAIDKTLLLSKLARAYARIAKNQTLLTAVNKSKGSLQKTPLDELTVVLNAMLEAALGVKEELVKYGFKPTMEEEAGAAIAAHHRHARVRGRCARALREHPTRGRERGREGPRRHGQPQR